MRRGVSLLALASLLLFNVALRAADEEDPEFKGRKASEYIGLMEKLAKAKPADEKERETNIEKRRLVLEVLEVLGPKQRIVQGVIHSLRDDPEPAVREASARWFDRVAVKARETDAKMGEGIDALMRALKEDKAKEVREACAASLAGMAKARLDVKKAVPSLAAALKDPEPGPRAAAAEALGRIGPEAAVALPELTEALKEKKNDAFTRRYAALAIGLVKANDGETVKLLADVFKDPESPVGLREDVAKVLGGMGGDAAPAVPALAMGLKEKDRDVRRASAVALDNIGENAKEAFPALRAALKDEDKGVRCVVMHALGNFGSDAKEAVPDLITAAKDPVQEVRLAAIRALGAIGPDAKDALPTLIAASRDSQKDISEAASEAARKVQGN